MVLLKTLAPSRSSSPDTSPIVSWNVLPARTVPASSPISGPPRRLFRNFIFIPRTVHQVNFIPRTVLKSHILTFRPTLPSPTLRQYNLHRPRSAAVSAVGLVPTFDIEAIAVQAVSDEVGEGKWHFCCDVRWGLLVESVWDTGR
jgi:hypothetical protein